MSDVREPPATARLALHLPITHHSLITHTMTTELKDRIMSLMRDMGYNAEIDEDGDIRIVHEMKTMFVLEGPGDGMSVNVIYPGFMSVDQTELPQTLFICNTVNRRMMFVKCYIEDDFENVTATCEFHFTADADLGESLQNAIAALGRVRSYFTDTHDKMESE